jgi:hypothetical protein
VCEWLSAPVSCLPSAVNLLFLLVLFMQISGVRLTLTWPHRLCLLRVLLCASRCYKLPLSKHTGGSNTAPAFSGLRVYLQFTWEVGLPPLSCGVFLPLPLSQAFLLLVAGRAPPLPPSLARPGLFIYSSGRGSPPPFWHSRHPNFFVTCLYCSYCSLLSFSFFPVWRSVCPGGSADLAQGCLWKYCVPLSSPCLHLPKPSGRRCLAARGPSWFLGLM